MENNYQNLENNNDNNKDENKLNQMPQELSRSRKIIAGFLGVFAFLIIIMWMAQIKKKMLKIHLLTGFMRIIKIKKIFVKMKIVEMIMRKICVIKILMETDYLIGMNCIFIKHRHI